MVRFERGRDVLPTAALALLCGLVMGWPSLAGGSDGSDWRKPFRPDEHTVVLYHFDEGEGNGAYDACGDAALTLRAHQAALWGSRPNLEVQLGSLGGRTTPICGSDRRITTSST